MDSSSSSNSSDEYRFYESSQSSENSSPRHSSSDGSEILHPLHSSSVEIPRSANPPWQNSSSVEIFRSINPPPLHSSSTPVGIPLSENPQLTEIPPNRPLPLGKRPGIIITDEEWNEELTSMFEYEDFGRFMRKGRCETTFMNWYMCMHHVLCHGRNWNECTELAGDVRDCIYGDLNHYHPLLTYFSQGRRYR